MKPKQKEINKKIKHLTLILFILNSLFYIGCLPPPKEPTEKTIPQWHINPPNDNAMFLYGSGCGLSQEESQHKALNRIASKISITIESIFESDTQERVFNSEHFNSSVTKQKIKSSVESMKFSNYRISRNILVNGQYYTLIELDREKFFYTKLKEVQFLDNEINKQWKRFQSISIIEKLQFSKDIRKNIDKAYLKFPILSAISENFNDRKYREQYEGYLYEIKYLSNNAIVYFNKSKATTFQNIVKKYVSQLGMKIVKNREIVKKNQLNNLIIIDIKKSAEKKHYKSSNPKFKTAHFAQVKITLTCLNYANKVLSKNIISMLNISLESFQDAVNKTKKFENKIKDHGILNILMGENN